MNKIEKNKKDIEKLETELQRYQEEIETFEKEKEKMEKELDIYKYRNLVNSINSMNKFYENEQKNNKIMEEIKLTKEQINKLKIKEHVMKYIQENGDDFEEIDSKENIIEETKYEKKTDEISSDLFSELNKINNNEMENNKKKEDEGEYAGFSLMNNDNIENKDENLEKKIKELNEKIQIAVNVSN